MKLPSDVQFHEENHLLVYRPQGVLNESAVNKIIRIVGKLEAISKKPFNRFFDTLGHDDVQLNFEYVVHIAIYRRLSYSGRPSVKSAILATDSTIVHYAKLHALMTQGSSIKVKIFQDRKEAARWLGVAEELLLAPASV
jgi:hypothetical protein